MLQKGNKGFKIKWTGFFVDSVQCCLYILIEANLAIYAVSGVEHTLVHTLWYTCRCIKNTSPGLALHARHIKDLMQYAGHICVFQFTLDRSAAVSSQQGILMFVFQQPVYTSVLTWPLQICFRIIAIDNMPPKVPKHSHYYMLLLMLLWELSYETAARWFLIWLTGSCDIMIMINNGTKTNHVWASMFQTYICNYKYGK